MRPPPVPRPCASSGAVSAFSAIRSGSERQGRENTLARLEMHSSHLSAQVSYSHRESVALSTMLRPFIAVPSASQSLYLQALEALGS